MWIADSLPGGRIGVVGKAHHCMVDGTAVVELGKLLLDPEPHARGRARATAWIARAGAVGRRAPRRAVGDRAADGASLAPDPGAPRGAPARGLPGLARRGARTLSHTVLPPAPSSPLNRPGSPRRHHVRLTRSLGELREIRKRFRVSPNDVVLAACAGALRRFAERRGETPQRLKVMVPADVRGTEDADSGNRIAFTFIDLPCDEPDPVERLRARPRRDGAAGRDGEAEDVDAAFQTLALTPRPLQRALAHAFAHPRLSNLTISTVAGRRAAALHARLPAARGPLRHAARRPPRALDRRRHGRRPGLLRRSSPTRRRCPTPTRSGTTSTPPSTNCSPPSASAPI